MQVKPGNNELERIVMGPPGIHQSHPSNPKNVYGMGYEMGMPIPGATSLTPEQQLLLAAQQ